MTVPRTDTPKPVTFVYPYYENPVFFLKQLRHWAALSVDRDLSSLLAVNVVDDGSQVNKARAVLDGWRDDRVRLFEIHEDRRWNWLAARNIGMHHAHEGWCLLTDMDHVVNGDTFRSVIYGDHNPEVIYGFSRVEHTGAVIGSHPNSWLMTRAMFWKVGGYDETLSGLYGSDGEWRRRCAATAPMQILSDQLVRYEFVDDSSTTAYKRKQPEDAAVKRLVSQRKNGWRPKVLSFPYQEVPLRCQ